MKFFVNENCIGCGLCVSVCPEVFHMTPDGVSKSAEESVYGGIADSAKEAMRDFPVSAIVKK